MAWMARRLRTIPGKPAYHVTNGSSGNLRLFGDDADHEVLVRVLTESRAPDGERVCGFVRMANHFHSVL